MPTHGLQPHHTLQPHKRKEPFMEELLTAQDMTLIDRLSAQADRPAL